MWNFDPAPNRQVPTPSSEQSGMSLVDNIWSKNELFNQRSGLSSPNPLLGANTSAFNSSLWNNSPASKSPSPVYSQNSFTHNLPYPLTEQNLSMLTNKQNPQVIVHYNVNVQYDQLEQLQKLHNLKEESNKSNEINPELYKTELCQQYSSKGSCPYGSKCQFAHGENELKSPKRPSNWKTKPCINWSKFGNCRYGKRCCFRHGDE